jgi:o-succinylbenzoate synthase
MNIYRSVYSHEPIPGKSLQGSVIKVDFDAHRTGYADIHPWPDQGDVDLEDQYDFFLGGNPTILFVKALFFAAEDAAARRANRNLLMGLDLPSSHFLYSKGASLEKAVSLGYTRIKVKHTDLQDLEKMPASVKFRVDINAKMTYPEFHLWWEDLSDSVRNRIEAIEDPWEGLGGEFESPNLLFSDWRTNPNWKSRVLKPARDLADTGEVWPRVIFTHSLDHPIGQTAALWEAARFYKKHPRLREVCGFPQEDKAFSDYYPNWKIDGPTRRPAPGLGFGFDDQLNSLEWEKVI